MKLIVHTVLFLIALPVSSQNLSLQLAENGIYASSDDYLNKKLTSGFNSDDGAKFSAMTGVTITILDGKEKTMFYCDEIWGYRKDGTDWRVSNEETYRVDYIGKVCLYKLMGEPGLGIPDYVYFSASPDLSIHKLTRKNLLAVFHSDRAFVERVKKMPWFRCIDRWDRKKGSYDFIDWIE